MANNTVDIVERCGPLLFVVPFSAAIFGFYGTFLPYGAAGIGFTLIGLFWALLL